jgi:hypothetical protein
VPLRVQPTFSLAPAPIREEKLTPFASNKFAVHRYVRYLPNDDEWSQSVVTTTVERAPRVHVVRTAKILEPVVFMDCFSRKIARTESSMGRGSVPYYWTLVLSAARRAAAQHSTHMKKSHSSDLEQARTRVATAETAVEKARHDSREAKRKRKLAKEAARNAKKQLKHAKEILSEAKRTLADAEGNRAREAGRTARVKRRVGASPHAKTTVAKRSTTSRSRARRAVARRRLKRTAGSQSPSELPWNLGTPKRHHRNLAHRKPKPVLRNSLPYAESQARASVSWLAG